METREHALEGGGAHASQLGAHLQLALLGVGEILAHLVLAAAIMDQLPHLSDAEHPRAELPSTREALPRVFTEQVQPAREV